jgi:hypothetical protein
MNKPKQHENSKSGCGTKSVQKYFTWVGSYRYKSVFSYKKHQIKYQYNLNKKKFEKKNKLPWAIFNPASQLPPHSSTSLKDLSSQGILLINNNR